MIYRIYLYITKFIYYGRIGAKLVDYDANCIDNLVHAHMIRVKKFMLSNKTHLMWNRSTNTKGMKRLLEFCKLTELKSEHEGFNDMYNYKKCLEENNLNSFDLIFNRKKDCLQRKLIRKSMERDRLVAKVRHERYYYMLEKYVPGFWD